MEIMTNNKKKTSTCPKMKNCNASVCPIDKQGKHLKDEGICFYAMEYVKEGAEEKFNHNSLGGIYKHISENLEWLKAESADIRKRLDKAAKRSSRLASL